MAGERDPHFNVFHAYRGAAPDAAARARQLEDNLTRALAITLAHVRGTDAAARLLSELGVPEGLRLKAFEIQLQVPAVTISWPSPDQRQLVAIVAGKADAQPGEPADLATDAPPAARPDLVLLWETHALVIESEVTPGADLRQMERMASAFETHGSGSSFGQTTWHRLAIAARGLHLGLTEVQTFVITQFEEYLRMNGFGGFAAEHFTYFAVSPEQRQNEVATRVGVRRALMNLLHELQQGWPSDWVPYVGNLNPSATGLWGKLQGPGKMSPHLSIGVDAGGLGVFANVETHGPFVQFRKAWETNPGGLVSLVRRLSGGEFAELEQSPWSVIVTRRLQQYNDQGELRPRKFWYLPAITVTASAAAKSDGLIERVLNDAVGWYKTGEEANPEITIHRQYQRWQVLSPGFIGRLIEDLRALEEFFSWIGQPVR